VLLPRAALRGDSGSPWVWRVTAGHVQRVPVTVGRDFGEQMQVTAGLADGDTVVVGEPPPLRDGQTVTVAAGR
jgi:hypothetical protein